MGSSSLLTNIILAGIGLAVGGLVVGNLFGASVTTFTDAFIGRANTGNYTGATASVGQIVPLMWVLGFLGVFLAVFISTLKRAR